MGCHLCQNSYKLHVHHKRIHINACMWCGAYDMQMPHIKSVLHSYPYVNAACIHYANELVAYTNAAYTLVYVPGIII